MNNLIIRSANNTIFPFLEFMSYPYWLWWDYSVNDSNRLVAELPELLYMTHQEHGCTEEFIINAFNVIMENLEIIDFNCDYFDLYNILKGKNQLRFLHNGSITCTQLIRSMLTIAKTGEWNGQGEASYSRIRLFQEFEDLSADLREDVRKKRSQSFLSSIYNNVITELNLHL